MRNNCECDVKRHIESKKGVSVPLTGMEAGLLTTTTSSSMWTMVIGSAVTGTSCLENTRENNSCFANSTTHQSYRRVLDIIQLRFGFGLSLCV